MPEITASKYLVTAGWDDAPHLDEQAKAELLESTPPYLRDARSKGIPRLGAGVIYPFTEDDFVIDPIELPSHWRRGYGMDVGWNKTAAIWGAHDAESDVVYLYSEHYEGEQLPEAHALAIKKRGDLMGAIDPAANGRGQKDGEQLLQLYEDAGLRLEKADNAVEVGLLRVYQRLASGRLKVFRSLTNWLAEFRLYRRDEKGKVVKTFDHLMDATRYFEMTGMDNLEYTEKRPHKRANRVVMTA